MKLPQGLLISEAQRSKRIIAGKRKKSLADVLHLGSLLDRSADIDLCTDPQLSLDHSLNISEMPLAVVLDDRLEVSTFLQYPSSSSLCVGLRVVLG